jgi:hypothetical protein
MNILILDDDEFRHEAYSVTYRRHDVTHVYTYSDFLAALSSGSPWDLIHLDHDLGDLVVGDTYIDGWGHSREYNGQHASLRICELPDDMLPTRVIIQSVNPDGARAMRSNLLRRGVKVSWAPFGEDPRTFERL